MGSIKFTDTIAASYSTGRVTIPCRYTASGELAVAPCDHEAWQRGERRGHEYKVLHRRTGLAAISRISNRAAAWRMAQALDAYAADWAKIETGREPAMERLGMITRGVRESGGMTVEQHARSLPRDAQAIVAALAEVERRAYPDAYTYIGLGMDMDRYTRAKTTLLSSGAIKSSWHRTELTDYGAALGNAVRLRSVAARASADAKGGAR